MNRIDARSIVFLCVLGALAANDRAGFLSTARADDWKFGGHAKYQLTRTDYRDDDVNAVLGDDPAWDQGVDVRLKTEWHHGAWDAAVHGELLAARGGAVDARRQLSALGLVPAGSVSGLPDDRRRLFDLTHELSNDGDTVAVDRLDRLSVGYTGDRGVLRVGRQAVSWGNGLVFQPLDFVNPFSPVAIDKDYKTGDDMLYGQWALDGGDVQGIVLPRRDPDTRRVDRAQGSYALKWRQRFGGFDVDVMGARHVDENLAGLGLARSIGGAVWRADVLHGDLATGGGAWSWVTNVDYSWTWAGHNVYGFAEYFRNGVGETDRAHYLTPNAALAARIDRGELYTLARDYLALGGQVEFDPLLNFFTLVIRNLNDGSAFLQFRGVYDWRQDVQLMGGVNVPVGDRGDEYGGVRYPGTGAYAGTGRALYARVAYYF